MCSSCICLFAHAMLLEERRAGLCAPGPFVCLHTLMLLEEQRAGLCAPRPFVCLHTLMLLEKRDLVYVLLVHLFVCTR